MLTDEEYEALQLECTRMNRLEEASGTARVDAERAAVAAVRRRRAARNADEDTARMDREAWREWCEDEDARQRDEAIDGTY